MSSGQALQWGALSLTSPFDLILIGAALALAFTAWRARPALWEIVVTLALAVLTVQASRNGVWLVFFLTPLAARGARERAPDRNCGNSPSRVRSQGENRSSSRAMPAQ